MKLVSIELMYEKRPRIGFLLGNVKKSSLYAEETTKVKIRFIGCELIFDVYVKYGSPMIIHPMKY